jgi:hypothetical protein
MVMVSSTEISAPRSHEGIAVATVAPLKRRRNSRRLGEKIVTISVRDFDAITRRDNLFC